ncbi:hypothetical protein Rmet_6633 (plasmid) [Cupriavidus metallidurans CH34]|uniref:Uncharacterized protein n=1 Tax=Cupriavidus metallidurans (strain ATCC 43123 / DSM 2839 / NBRC 102507 / CH34) TaxID=266264 RepID=D3DY21_CUPMC|nr:hypothetical protein Rmet_6590 [Cupriavidus metallidurans CH34]ADC45233.1 hypothetical protein Rmet_6633 [Cupriavidus metallidurans CH34]
MTGQAPKNPTNMFYCASTDNF